jgi:hypothetical protein
MKDFKQFWLSRGFDLPEHQMAMKSGSNSKSGKSKVFECTYYALEIEVVIVSHGGMVEQRSLLGVACCIEENVLWRFPVKWSFYEGRMSAV